MFFQAVLGTLANRHAGNFPKRLEPHGGNCCCLPAGGDAGTDTAGVSGGENTQRPKRGHKDCHCGAYCTNCGSSNFTDFKEESSMLKIHTCYGAVLASLYSTTCGNCGNPVYYNGWKDGIFITSDKTAWDVGMLLQHMDNSVDNYEFERTFHRRLKNCYLTHGQGDQCPSYYTLRPGRLGCLGVAWWYMPGTNNSNTSLHVIRRAVLAFRAMRAPLPDAAFECLECKNSRDLVLVADGVALGR